MYQGIEFQLLPCVRKKIVNILLGFGDDVADQWWQAAGVRVILQVGLRVVLLFAFEHKHFTMREAHLFLCSTA